jgi:adenylate cyclase
VRRLHASANGNERLPVGIGLNFGMARVGNVGVGNVKDFTAVGDVVNTAARLQACASAGEIVMSEAVYAHIRERYPTLAPIAFDVRGKTEAVAGRVLDADDPRVP